MLTISAKIREITGKKTKNLRKEGVLPAVLYGPKIKNLSLEMEIKDFERIFAGAGESSLVKLEVGEESPKQSLRDAPGQVKKEFQVLIHDVQYNPLSGRPIHVDFYLPSATEEIVVKVPVILEGEAPAVKELGGTLLRDIHEIEVRGLIQNLPKEIRVDISRLKTFQDHILIGDLNLPQGVKILKDSKEIVISVASPEKIEEKLAKPVEEKVEEVEVVEREKKEEVVEEDKSK